MQKYPSPIYIYLVITYVFQMKWLLFQENNIGIFVKMIPKFDEGLQFGFLKINDLLKAQIFKSNLSSIFDMILIKISF